MSENTTVLVNLGKVVPFSLAIKGEGYPAMDEILAEIKKVSGALFQVDGPTIVETTGVPRPLNVVMLGALAGLDILPFDSDILWQAVEKKSPPQFLEPNQMAFQMGMSAVIGNQLKS